MGKKEYSVSSPINVVFCLRIFCQDTHIVEDAETHREILLCMVTWWPKIAH